MKYTDDVVLKAAFTLAGEMEENIEIPEEKNEFSAEHEAKMQRLFATEKKNQRRKELTKYASRAAALFVAAVLVAGVSVGGVEVIKVSQTRKQDSTVFKTFEEAGDGLKVNGITFCYIPEGYHLVGDYTKSSHTVLEFGDGEHTIRFAANKINLDMFRSLDTKGAIITELEYKECRAIKSITDEIQRLVWYQGEYVYILECETGEEELMKIADNIYF